MTLESDVDLASLLHPQLGLILK